MFAEQSMERFLFGVASKNPVPGGGSVSAQSSATAAALLEMVASVTISKRGYEEYSNQMVDIQALVKRLRCQLVKLIDEDAEAFDQVMKAYKLPKETDEEKLARRKMIQKALKKAAEVPLKIGEISLELMEQAKFVINHGNKNAITDGGVGMMLAYTGLRGAVLNVKINLQSIRDEAYTKKMNETVEMLLQRGSELEKPSLNYIDATFDKE